MLRASRLLSVVLVVLAGAAMAAPGDTRVGSTRPVRSPDGTRMVVVDHVMPVVDGEADRFSGRMVVRVTDAEGTTTRRRQVETSQISVIQSPRWLDDALVAYFYNIKKNANGIVYFDSRTGAAVQVEFVTTARRMAATNKVETAVTSIEVTEYATGPQRIATFVRDGAGVFPLFIRTLPPFENAPYPRPVYDDLRAALAARKDFLAARKIREMDPEVASESFSPDGKYLAALACNDGKPALVVVPLHADSARVALQATVVAPLDEEVTLNCNADAPAAPEGEKTADATSVPAPGQTQSGEFGGYRFTTEWKDAATILIVKETFETEEQPMQREPYFAVTAAGQATRLERKPAPRTPAAKTPEPEAVQAKPVETAPADKAASTGEKPAAKTPKPAADTARRTPKPDRTRKPEARSTPKPRATPKTEAGAPEPAPKPTPTPKPKSLLRRLLPGDSNPATTP